jgi:hypothetical protein
VNYCNTPGFSESKSPCHPTYRRSNEREGKEKHRRLRAGETPKHLEEATFKNRQTPVPSEEFEALSPDFVQTHHIQWNVFVKKIGEGHLADTFGTVIEDLNNFAIPALHSLASGEKLKQQWKAGSSWVAS